MQNTPSSIEQFKSAMDAQGFISPMLGKLGPSKKIFQTAHPQQIMGYVLEGNIEIFVDKDHLLCGKHQTFYIDGHTEYEIRSGTEGVEYLFAIKHGK